MLALLHNAAGEGGCQLLRKGARGGEIHPSRRARLHRPGPPSAADEHAAMHAAARSRDATNCAPGCWRPGRNRCSARRALARRSSVQRNSSSAGSRSAVERQRSRGLRGSGSFYCYHVCGVGDSSGRLRTYPPRPFCYYPLWAGRSSVLVALRSPGP